MDPIVNQINKKKWWHSPPIDKTSYKKRGVFLASSYKECEFYGRPLDNPVKVSILKPLIGTEEDIIKSIFGEDSQQMVAYMSLTANRAENMLRVRFQLDKDIYRAAKEKGYDSIVVVASKNIEKIKEGKLPQSIELNIFNTKNTSLTTNQRAKGLS